ncbi:hypothetical protein DVH05_005264 [Phytophthora capsici]|nr:hypothetical protein DVH05_005264 [Phytophthora capsici]
MENIPELERRQRLIAAEIQAYQDVLTAYENLRRVRQTRDENGVAIQAAVARVARSFDTLIQARQLADQADQICYDAFDRALNAERSQRREEQDAQFTAFWETLMPTPAALLRRQIVNRAPEPAATDDTSSRGSDDTEETEIIDLTDSD